MAVLRWEIENVNSMASDAESAVVQAGGFEWKASARPRISNPEILEILITCNLQREGEWKCDANVTCNFFTRINSPFTIHHISNFDRKKKMLTLTHEHPYDAFQTPMSNVLNKTMIIEFNIYIVSVQVNEVIEAAPSLDLAKCCSPNELSNVTLVIGEHKLRVSKDYLAIHSPVFAAMFFKEFAEKEKEEIEIKEVVFEEFLDLLHLIFSRRVPIRDSTISHILELADRFEVKDVLDDVEAHLMNSSKLKNAEKLLLADQYRLALLRAHILQCSGRELKALKSAPEYDRFSDNMRAAIGDRALDLL